MKQVSAYVWITIGAIVGFGLSWVIPGLDIGAGIAIGVAMGVAMTVEDAGCHLPWRRDRSRRTEDQRPNS